ncbi:glycoside hydrolase family 97 protein [Pedobacter frigiditerrae]|uniref:Glycoside hydrolase family 97 protein n=1 Tax=Pedobacter frigiditerrae TaxID=2530452 RepID=A0A4R0MYE8_9SPHI|nr:glycoside hydrolase family 97 protein [Pedobacter frigiditerrae]TCC92358.1 glycoside hydrolase family 97 protein [Pedobacter frigiditerrae]
MRRFLPVFYILFFLASATFAQGKFTLKSPDGNISANITSGKTLGYSIALKQQEIIGFSPIGLKLENELLGNNTVPNQTSTQKKARYNELTLSFTKKYKVVFRLYNEGFTYRFITHLKDSVKVLNETATFNIKPNAAAILQETDNYTTWEGRYVKSNAVGTIPLGKRATTPALFAYPNEVKVVIAESDLFDYPGMYIKTEKSGFIGEWAQLPSHTVMGSWGNFVSVVKDRYPFIAKTAGDRSYPWRIAIISTDDKQLLTNHLVTELATPSKIKDPSWIKPGKAAWEWWHDALLPGAAIPSGMDNRNTRLYNYYVDFAAANKLEYLMVDAGWSDNYDLTRINPKNDIRAVIAHARSKNVGVFLWCVATTLLKDIDKNLDFIQSLGAAGLKVDFIDRDDQEAIKWFELIAKAAAKRKLMINFHGCSKPTGLEKTYPNIVNYEAVRGAESNKWDYTINPDLHVLTPFVRMLAGPFDYTPGAMRNKTKEMFKPIDPGLPSAQGTRCHELAMYVIYNQPLAMLSDSPTAYMKEDTVMRFLSAVPTVFDEEKALSAKLGEQIVIAKRKGKNWFVGGMTNWDEREVNIDFSFLSPSQQYQAEIYIDGPGANGSAEEYLYKTIKVNNKTILPVKMAKGGGFALYIHP